MDINWQNIEVINASDRFKPASRLVPPVDELVSQIVGRRVFSTDPRLIKLIVKWRKNKPLDSMEPDRFLDDPRKVEELKQVFTH